MSPPITLGLPRNKLFFREKGDPRVRSEVMGWGIGAEQEPSKPRNRGNQCQASPASSAVLSAHPPHSQVRVSMPNTQS